MSSASERSPLRTRNAPAPGAGAPAGAPAGTARHKHTHINAADASPAMVKTKTKAALGQTKPPAHPGTTAASAAAVATTSVASPPPAHNLPDLRRDMLSVDKETLSQLCGLSVDMISPSPRRRRRQGDISSPSDSDGDSDDLSSSDDVIENADPRFKPPRVPRSPTRAAARLRLGAHFDASEQQQPPSILAPHVSTSTSNTAFAETKTKAKAETAPATAPERTENIKT